jgi:hypothetical protein
MKNLGYLCNTSFMPIFEGKRLEFVGVKFNQAEKEYLEKIAADEDRALSYIVRELALRGLVQYLKDKNIKTTGDETQFALNLLNSNIKPLGEPVMIPVEKLEPGEIEKKKKVG